MAADDAADRKVKDVLDAATRAGLERWFGPTTDASAPAVEDPEIASRRDRVAQALEAIDLRMVTAVEQRTTRSPIAAGPPPRLRVDPSIARVDLAMIERHAGIAEPREVDIPDALRDDLRECTPQALLRDLHRAELEFELALERVDFAAEQRVDAVAAVADAMATSWKLEVPRGGHFAEGAAVLRDARDQRRHAWSELLALGASPSALPNRRWTEDR